MEVLTQEYIEEMKKQQKIGNIEIRLDELTKDFVQVQCGAVIENIDERISEFQTLHNELRVLKGKEPREYTK